MSFITKNHVYTYRECTPPSFLFVMAICRRCLTWDDAPFAVICNRCLYKMTSPLASYFLGMMTTPALGGRE